MLKIVGFFFISYSSCGLSKQLFFCPFSLVLNVPSTKCGQIKCRRFCTIVSRMRLRLWPRLGPAIQLTNTIRTRDRTYLNQPRHEPTRGTKFVRRRDLAANLGQIVSLELSPLPSLIFINFTDLLH